MFTSIYRPNKLDDFVGNAAIMPLFITWLLEWSPTKKPVSLIFGVNGVGKSLLTELILKKYSYNIITATVEDTSMISSWIQIRKTVDGQDNVLVLSDIDSNDYGQLTGYFKETQIPIVCICDDKYSQSIKSVLPFCCDIKLMKPSFTEVYRLIYKIVVTEKIKINKSTIDTLYEQSNGDIRFILNSLQMALKKTDTSKNIQCSNIFDTTGHLFSLETSLEDKVKHFWMAHDIHTLMIHENYIHNTLTVKDEVKRLENLAFSADSLSDTDLFETVFDLNIATYTAIRATTKCNKKGFVKFPQILSKISITNRNKRDKLNYETISFEKEKIVKKDKIVKKEKIIKEKVIKEKVIKEKVVKEKSNL